MINRLGFLPMPAHTPIEHYGIIGDCRTAALVSRAGERLVEESHSPIYGFVNCCNVSDLSEFAPDRNTLFNSHECCN